MRNRAVSGIPALTLVSGMLAFATPASLGSVQAPEVTMPGTSFNKISGYYPGLPHTGDPADEGQDGCTWYHDGTAIYTPWDHGGEANHLGHCLWVEYVAELTPGFWRLGLNAINHGRIKDRRWYPAFEVLVELEGPFSRPQRAIVTVPASDVQLRSGYQLFRILNPGIYGVKYTWLNDKCECTDPDWNPGDECGPGFESYDVNIMIDSVFFDGVRHAGGSGGIPPVTNE
jgi:hypothetical protein